LTEEKDKQPDDLDREWEQRVLCSDEGCIGVIGPDGRCKECGKPYEGELPNMSVEESGHDEAAPDDTPDEDQAPDTLPDAAGETDVDGEWAQRTLCSDESCIGTIGPDGRCKECGKPYEG